jgi:hypothetical protein
VRGMIWALKGHGKNSTPARAALALIVFMVMVLLITLGPVGASHGPLALAQSPSPTASPTGPTGPTINFLNPSVMPVTVGPPDSNETPVLADKPETAEGSEEDYDVVVWSSGLPNDAIVELSITPEPLFLPVGNEETIGVMPRVPDSPNTFELEWNIPESMPEGNATLTARAYEQRFTGLEEIAAVEMEVELHHSSENPPTGDGAGEDEVIELEWPTQGGPLGFYKQGSVWRSYLDAKATGRNQGIGGPENDSTFQYFTVSPPGSVPEWKQCATGNPSAAIRVTCVVPQADNSQSITAIGAVVREDQNPSPGVGGPFTLESSDAHAVRPYLQDPQLQMRAAPEGGGVIWWLPAKRAPAGDVCLAYLVTVTDTQHGRAVAGANLDYHITGPSDQVQFGDQDVVQSDLPFVPNSSNYATPTEGHPSTDAAYDCDDYSDEMMGPDDRQDFAQRGRLTEGAEGDHNVPGAPDTKHRESATGSGLDSGRAGRGQHMFHLFSRDPGFTDILVWIDDDPLTDPKKPHTNNDVHDVREPSVQARAQWLPQGGWVSMSIDPPGATALPGTCVPLTVRLRDEGARVVDANIDIHAAGPDDNLSFCDPTGANPRAAPDEPDTDHTPEGPGHAAHSGTSPRAKHTEGFTDEEGNFTFGVTSGVQGDSTIQAWFDEDWGDDLIDTDVVESFEEIATATVSWGATLETAQVSFLNPSPYGNPTDGGGDGTQVSNVEDADNRYHIVTRTNAVAAPGMELLISEDGENFTRLGDATQIGGTDTWEFFWDVNVPDGEYTLRAQLFGTSRLEDIEIVVNKTGPGPSDQDPTPAEETVEITSPVNGSVVGISRGEINVRGSTSAGAEGVDLFYTKMPSFDTPTEDDWIFCGFAKPASRSFTGKCTIDPSDQAAHITGVAAIAYDCFQSGCSAQENESPFRDPGENDSGDAHRLFGIEANPIISLEPAEAQQRIRSCRRFELRVSDSTGQALGGENVDIHASGPRGVGFCDPDGASARRAPGDGAHVTGDDPNEGAHDDGTKHIEAETGRGGRVVFGLNSGNAGDTQISAWLDRNDNDAVDSGEPVDTSVMHWTRKSRRGRCTEVGTAGRDVIKGTRGRDVLCGRAGRDRIVGRGGNDVLIGGRGKDVLIGNQGKDILRGARGRDVLRGGRGRDRLNGGKGKDRLNGGRGRDTCRGGAGRNRFKNCERRH